MSLLQYFVTLRTSLLHQFYIYFMLPYKDIFLDFDDTLYDTRGNATLALEELYDAFHLEEVFDSKRFFTEHYWEINENLWAQYSLGEITRDYLIIERFRRPLALGHGANLSHEFCLGLGDAFLEFNCAKTGVVEGAHDLLDYLKSRGYRLHICSNGFTEVQYRKLDMVGMSDYFDTIVLSEQAGVNKPSPKFFEFAFSQSKAVATSTIMIGDNFSTDILGAMGAGLDTIYFNSNKLPLTSGAQKKQTEYTPTYIVNSLSEIRNIL